MAKIVTERQRRVAELLLDGLSGYRALRQAGYGHWTARKFGFLLRNSWGLREAIRQEQERRFPLDRPAPMRTRRFDRRKVQQAVKDYADPRIKAVMSNRDCKRYYQDIRHGEALKKYEQGEIQEPPKRSSGTEFKPFSNKCNGCGAYWPGGFLCVRCSGGW